MAQTSYTPISLYYSTTASATPTAGNLVNGELAINITDGKIFYKDNSGVVQTIASKATGTVAGTTTQVIYNNAGAYAGSANFTFNGTTVTIANDASISGLTVGKGGGAVSHNTVVGASAMAATASGDYNTAYGYTALGATTSGTQNTALGGQAMNTNTTGSYNVGVGVNALQQNTSGSNNIAIGVGSLTQNSTASNNTAVGFQAGYSNTTGNFLTSVGYQSLYSNTTGIENSAFGRGALGSNSTGSYNTAIGSIALNSNTTASNNTAVGYQAGYSNTTGTGNTFIGRVAGYSNTTTNDNAYIGYQAGYLTTSSSNTLVGVSAGYSSTTGGSNTFVGQGSGELVSTGGKNSILGRYNGNQGGLDIRTASNYIVLSDGDGNPRIIGDSSGNWGIGAASGGAAIYIEKAQDSMLNLNATGGYNPLIEFKRAGTRYGYFQPTVNDFRIAAENTTNGLVITAGGSGGVKLTNTATSWVSNSDITLKNVTGTYETPLADIAQIEAIKFTWKSDETNRPQVGVSAQSVQKVIPEAVEADNEGILGVRYTEIIPLLVASIQELNAKVTALEAQLQGK